MKSLDQIGQTSVQRGMAGRRGPQSWDNASTHAWTETPHSRNTHTRTHGYTMVTNAHNGRLSFLLACRRVTSRFNFALEPLRTAIMCPDHTHPSMLCKRAAVHESGTLGSVWVGGGGGGVCTTPRAREVTGTTTNPEAVPMATSVAAHNEGERE